MKVIITSTGDSKHAMSDMRFGRCAYFAVYDLESNTYEFFENDAIHSSHGAGIGAAQKIQDLNAKVVLTGRLGPKAKQVLDASSIKGFRIQDTKVEDAVEAYKKGHLSEITDAQGPGQR